LNVNGIPFVLKGASWFGLETSNNVFHGLWAQDYHTLLQFLATNGFNAIRVPFYLDLVLHDAKPDSINFYQMNQDLQNLTSLQVLDKVIAAAADLGLLIMLDLHSFAAGTFMENGLWYDSTHPETLVLQGWDILINRYANQWNVIAFDLKNEPFSTTWGGPNATDWSAASVRISNHILSSTGGARFLVFVEGTANSPACAQNCFWGENLQGALTSPLTISNQKKLVYSPHCYGPSVAYQPYFNDPTFPANMPAIWDAHYGTVNTKTGQAVVLGEWGGQLANPDGTWLTAFVQYLLQRGLTSQFFWCLNPDSGDTGGLLMDDWKTPVTGKLTLLQQLDPKPAQFSYANGQYCVTV
jgi:endoglucanase